MSVSAFPLNSDNPVCKIEQLNMKLEAVMASHRMLVVKAASKAGLQKILQMEMLVCVLWEDFDHPGLMSNWKFLCR